MQANKVTEIIQLETEKKWEFLKRYYEAAAKFYDINDVAVSEDEIDACLSKYKTVPKPVIRKELSLDDWKFITDADDRGVKEGYFLHASDEGRWSDVKIPHGIRQAPPEPDLYGYTDYCVFTHKDKPYYEILRGETHAWYKTRPSLDGLKDDEVAYLSFGSINLDSDVWVNDYPVITDHLGLFPFGIEVTESLKMRHDRDPVVSVRVSNVASNTPYTFYNGFQFAYVDRQKLNGENRFDWNDQAWLGIAGDVTLSILNKRHISNVFIHTKSADSGNSCVCFDVSLRNQSNRKFTGKITIEISDWSPEEGDVIKKAEARVEMLPLNDGKASILMDIKDAKLWSPDNPNLYLTHITLEDMDGTPIDDIFESFGVRTFEMKGSHFYLNGRKTVLRGTHDFCNYYGEPVICPGDRTLIKDLLLHKKMGANCSRWPSDIRMHYRKLARFCDQFGLMLSWAGYFEVWTQHSDIEMLMTRDVPELVRNLRNHPSIVIWEMGDEALMQIYEYRRTRFHELMFELTGREDPTRPIIPNGYYCGDLIDAILAYPGDDDLEVKRQRVLEEYPVFANEKAVWDYHKCPYFEPFPPEFEFIENARAALGGYKPTVYTEFGCDALPNPDNVKDIYGGFRWKANAFISGDRDTLDMGQYGKLIKQEDLRGTQAFQAQAVSSIIKRLRQYPEEIAAYYFCTMFDVWICYWGATDARGNCKLLYYVAKNYFQPLFVSALHGNTVTSINDGLEITASNYNEDISDAVLTVIFRDRYGSVALEKIFNGINAAGDVSLTCIAKLELTGLQPGLYSVEYHMADRNGKHLGKTFEMAYFE